MTDSTKFIYDNEKGELVATETEDVSESAVSLREFSTRKLAEDEMWMMIPEFIQEREWPMFQSIQVYILDKLKEYLVFKGESLKTSPTITQSKEWTYKDIAKDLDDSELLMRLLSGKDPLPVAPPKSFSHYWYDLVDDGSGVCIEVEETSYTSYANGSQTPVRRLRIDNEDWTIIKELEGDTDKSFIVQWKETDYIFKVERMTPEDFETMLHPRLRKMVTRKKYSWKITRCEEGWDHDESESDVTA